MFFTKMSVFLPSKDPPEKFKRAVARSGAFSFLESAKPDRLLGGKPPFDLKILGCEGGYEENEMPT